MSPSVRKSDAALDLDSYKALEKSPLYLVLDNLRSAFNVGAIFRIAECLRVSAVITCGYTAHPPHPKLLKTSRGSSELVKWEHYPTCAEAIENLKTRGITVIAVETSQSASAYTDFQYPLPCALVFGNEALGISEAALTHCKHWVEIPVYGIKNSLNVATACAIMAYSVVGQWQRDSKLHFQTLRISLPKHTQSLEGRSIGLEEF